MTALLDRVADAVRDWRAAQSGPLVVGICGAQGSGKSTLAVGLKARLEGEGARVAVLSLDDLYLSHAERAELAADIHPLFATRGVPGTHDVELGIAVLDALTDGRATALPRFDKAHDDPVPASEWPVIHDPVDVILFEGWCVGAIAQDPADLTEPVNDLERERDADSVWRTYANTQLVGLYARLYGRLDRLILLAAPGFEIVQAWRTQQEHDLARDLAAKGITGTHVMSDAEVVYFIQHYERLTRHILREMPSRADLTLRIDADRNLIEA